STQGPRGLATQQFPVALATEIYPFPSRTRKSSLSAPMVLGGQPPGRVGRRRNISELRRALATARARFAPADSTIRNPLWLLLNVLVARLGRPPVGPRVRRAPVAPAVPRRVASRRSAKPATPPRSRISGVTTRRGRRSRISGVMTRAGRRSRTSAVMTRAGGRSRTSAVTTRAGRGSRTSAVTTRPGHGSPTSGGRRRRRRSPGRIARVGVESLDVAPGRS
ncbi:MAG: hypothetical protein QOI61_745, partial [Actinomycetota bacterium]